MRLGLTSITLLFLAACGSSPKTAFYTLSVAHEGSGRISSLRAPVQLAAVHVPPLLDRRQMVRMSSVNRVQISETNRWSAAFDEMVRNVLAQDLAERLPNGRLIFPEAPAPAGANLLVVTIAKFSPDASGNVSLRASWSLLESQSNASLLHRDVECEGGAAPDADAAAAAMSRALGQLADKIASALAHRG